MNYKSSVLMSGVVAALAFLLATSGCGNKQEETVTVSIQQTSPSGDVPLVAGDTVTFQIDVRVQGLQTAGQLGLIVQSAEGIVVAECDPVAVSNGAAVRLSAVGLVPETTVVRVFTPLYVSDSNKTKTLDTRLFKVIGRRTKG